MARKDVSDRLVCLACAYWQTLRDIPTRPWPYDTLSVWTGQPEKVCYLAMERAEDHGLLEYGVSLRTAWLTDKGKALLGDIDIEAEVKRIARDYDTAGLNAHNP